MDFDKLLVMLGDLNDRTQNFKEELRKSFNQLIHIADQAGIKILIDNDEDYCIGELTFYNGELICDRNPVD